MGEKCEGNVVNKNFTKLMNVNFPTTVPTVAVTILFT